MSSSKLGQPLAGGVSRCYSTKSSSVFNLFSRRKEKQEKLKEEELKEKKFLAEERFMKEEETVRTNLKLILLLSFFSTYFEIIASSRRTPRADEK